MNKKIKIVYCLPLLYIPGGMERVLTIKANYFAEKLGYDIYIILTDGKGLEPFHAAVVDRVYKVNFPSEHGYGDVRPYFKQTLREAFFV